MLLFNAAGFVLVYALQRLQNILPLNPAGMPAVPADLSFNTAVSFATNTNWQNYGGESTMSYLTQMAALTTQNFVSAATGIALAIALIRAFARDRRKPSVTSGSISPAPRSMSSCRCRSLPRSSSSGKAFHKTSDPMSMRRHSKAPSRH